MMGEDWSAGRPDREDRSAVSSSSSWPSSMWKCSLTGQPVLLSNCKGETKKSFFLLSSTPWQVYEQECQSVRQFSLCRKRRRRRRAFTASGALAAATFFPLLPSAFFSVAAAVEGRGRNF